MFCNDYPHLVFFAVFWLLFDHFSGASGAGGMNREEAPGKSPEEMYIQQKVRVLLMLKKMGSNVSVNSNTAKVIVNK